MIEIGSGKREASGNGLHNLVKALEIKEHDRGGKGDGVNGDSGTSGRRRYSREELVKIRENGGGRRPSIKNLGVVYDAEVGGRWSRILEGKGRAVARGPASDATGSERWTRGLEGRFESLRRSPERSPERSPRASPRLVPVREKELVPLDESWFKPHPLLDASALDGPLEEENSDNSKTNGDVGGKMTMGGSVGFVSHTGGTITGSPQRRPGMSGKNHKSYVKMAKGPQSSGGFAVRIAYRDGHSNSKGGVKRRAKSPNEMVAHAGGEIGRLFAVSSKVAPPPAGLSSMSKKRQSEKSMVPDAGIHERADKVTRTSPIKDEKSLQAEDVVSSGKDDTEDNLDGRSRASDIDEMKTVSGMPELLISETNDLKEPFALDPGGVSVASREAGSVPDLLSSIRKGVINPSPVLTSREPNTSRNVVSSAPDSLSKSDRPAGSPLPLNSQEPETSVRRPLSDFLAAVNNRVGRGSPGGAHGHAAARLQGGSSEFFAQGGSGRSVSLPTGLTTSSGDVESFESPTGWIDVVSALQDSGEPELRARSKPSNEPEEKAASSTPKSDVLDPGVLSFFDSVKEMAISGKRSMSEMSVSNGHLQMGHANAGVSYLNPAPGVPQNGKPSFGVVGPEAHPLGAANLNGILFGGRGRVADRSGDPPSGAAFYGIQGPPRNPEISVGLPFPPHMTGGHPQHAQSPTASQPPFRPTPGPGTPITNPESMHPSQNLRFMGPAMGPNGVGPSPVVGASMGSNTRPVVGATYKPQEFFSMFQGQDQAVQQSMQQHIQGRMPQEMPQQVQQQMAPRMTQQIQHQMQQQVQEQMRHRMHLHMQQQMQHQMRGPQSMFPHQFANNVMQHPIQVMMQGLPQGNQGPSYPPQAARQYMQQAFSAMPGPHLEGSRHGSGGVAGLQATHGQVFVDKGLQDQAIPVVGNAGSAEPAAFYEQTEKRI